ncbi:MAG: glycosyltransferase [Planctomycetaceae bacterium]|nr:glycosyltransferase [Planctomycetaceae bacterium]
MQLILLTPTLDQSGAEKQLTLLACGLRETTDWDIEVVALTRGGPYQQTLEQHQIPVTVLGKRFKFDSGAALRLRRLLRDRKPDVLHTWMFTANAYGRLIAGKNPACKLIASERCVDSWKSNWQRRVDRHLIERTDRLLANSQPVADFYHQLGYPTSKIVTISNGVEIPPPGNSERREQLHREWKLPAGARVVAHVGRLAKQKRLDDLMWAFQEFQQLSDNTYFVIAGDGPERSHLEDLAIRYTCDHLVRFIGHQPDGVSLMEGIDLFWLGSDFEGMSNSLMEAMAAGVPAVVSDIPANRELVVPGVTGELFPLGNKTAIAQLSDRLLNQPDVYDRMSKASVERMRDEFSVERMVTRHRELYLELLNEG